MRTIAMLAVALFAHTAVSAAPQTAPAAGTPVQAARPPANAAGAPIGPRPFPPLPFPPLSSTLIVATDIAGTAPVNNINGTTNTPLLQINGTDSVNTGYLEFRYGADPQGIYNVFVKTRGTAMNDYAAVQPGDRIVTNAIQAGSGGQAGHVGTDVWVVDGANITAGEINGRWLLSTGTGILSQVAAKTPYPERYGLMQAIVANSYQQVFFPGGIGGPNARLANGSNFGGWVVIGAGAPAPGFAPLKFQTNGAAILTTPEPGAFEVDAGARPYFTGADGVRRAFGLADTGTPVVAIAAGAGRGATVTVDASGSAGTIALVTGSSPTAGAVLTLTYAHPYAATSYPLFSPGNAAAATSTSQMYATGTRAGFALSTVAPLAAGTTYIVTYQAPGR